MRLSNFVVMGFFIFIIFLTPTFPQLPERIKPEIKDFGSSLKRTPEENSARKKTAQKTADSDNEVIKIDTNLVVVDCLVIDGKGNLIEGLTKDDFIIAEDGQPQEIQTFTLGNDNNLPRSIVLVIDYSGSQLPFIERSIEAAKLLVDKLRPNDLMAIVTDDVELISQFSANKILLKEKLESLKQNALSGKKLGRSMQFSSLYAVLNEMLDETDVRPIILFQTDGDQLFYLRGSIEYLVFQKWKEQQKSKFSPLGSFAYFGYNDLIQKIEQSRATIYTIVPGFRRIGLPKEKRDEILKAEAELRRQLYEKTFKKKLRSLPPREPNDFDRFRQELIQKYYPNGLPDLQDGLFRLSFTSGGWMDFLEKPEDADGIYSRILDQINNRYVIGYNPTNETKDGKRRTIKVTVKNHPEYIIWGKQSYFAPLPD